MAGEQKLENRPLDTLREMPLVELAHQLLEESNEQVYYRDLMTRIAALRQMSQDDIDDAIARLYTDINIDGRFLCIGDNVWGLRRWYPMEKTTERGAGKKFLRKEVDYDDDDDDIDGQDQDEEELIEEPPFGFGEDDDAVFADDEDVLEENGFTEEEAEVDDEELEIEEEEEEDEEF